MTRRPRPCNTVAPSMPAEPPFTEEHEILRDSIRRLVANDLRPHASAWEEAPCLQLHGGAGYVREYEVERMARDARLGPIGGGTDEVMKEILGKLMGL
jgi:alkylation response protein AidB-like acyl-CoA dehydrogenase